VLNKNSHKLLVESASEILLIWWLKRWSCFTFLILAKDLNILLATGAGGVLQTTTCEKPSDGTVLSWEMTLVWGEDAVPEVCQLL